MVKSKGIVLLWLMAFFLIDVFAQPQTYTVILSMDGFRWDYSDSFPTPHLKEMAKEGVHARSLIPVFPTLTFPNHYSMVTGVYPDFHGVVGNQFYASDLKQNYRYNDASAADGRFYGAEPIWVTARKNHVKTASYFWVGSEAEIQRLRPDYWKKYSSTDTYEQRIDTVVKWLSLPINVRPRLVMLYFDYPDHLTHSVGAFGQGVKEMVIRLDSLVGVLRLKLSQLEVAKQVNFIIVSDHGMETTNPGREVVLDNFIKQEWCERVCGHYSFFTIETKVGYSDSVYIKLKNAPYMKIWRKADVPKRLHFGNNFRIGQYVVLADSAYTLRWQNEKMDMKGNHGYDNQNTDMHGVFYAVGPSFKTGLSMEPFENVNIYLVLTKLLGVNAAPNNGDMKLVDKVLR